MTELTMKEAALEYARKGLPVLPLKPRDKIPYMSGGFKIATTNPEVIHGWWKERPDANIGIPTGDASDFFVVDIDGAQGIESLDALLHEHKYWPKTLTITTGGAGTHYCFKMPDGMDIRNSASQIGAKIRPKSAQNPGQNGRQTVHNSSALKRPKISVKAPTKADKGQ